ncbi:MAG: hypothetical protein K0Q58_1642 [Microbacterium sp.]|nr:hypothetical protein [Microbacterium sp.]
MRVEPLGHESSHPGELRRRDRLERVTGGGTGTGLHLDEGERAGIPRDDVDLTTRTSPVPLEHAESPGFEPGHRSLFTESSESAVPERPPRCSLHVLFHVVASTTTISGTNTPIGELGESVESVRTNCPCGGKKKDPGDRDHPGPAATSVSALLRRLPAPASRCARGRRPRTRSPWPTRGSCRVLRSCRASGRTSARNRRRCDDRRPCALRRCSRRSPRGTCRRCRSTGRSRTTSRRTRIRPSGLHRDQRRFTEKEAGERKLTITRRVRVPSAVRVPAS